MFTPKIATTLGVFAVSFFIHSVAVPIMKNNKEYHNNIRDLKLGFCLTGFIYISIGVFGAFAIAGKHAVDAQTSLDYLKDYKMTILISFFLLVQLMTSLPLVWYITRSQIFNFIYKDQLPQNINVPYFIVNSVFICIALIM